MPARLRPSTFACACARGCQAERRRPYYSERHQGHVSAKDEKVPRPLSSPRMRSALDRLRERADRVLRHPVQLQYTARLPHTPPSRLTSCALLTHAHTLNPAALAFVPFGIVLVRVRVPQYTPWTLRQTCTKFTSTRIKLCFATEQAVAQCF